MLASLSSISFNIRLLCTGLIMALLELGPGTILFYHLLFGTIIKLLHHSDASSMPRGTMICCFCNLSYFSFRSS